MGFFESSRGFVVTRLEESFQRFGRTVAANPGAVILVTAAISTICSLGLLTIRTESRVEFLWLPENSALPEQRSWINSNFPYSVRIPTTLFRATEGHGGNVLNKDSLLEMLKVHNRVNSLRSAGETKWSDLCAKVPVLKVDEIMNSIAQSINESVTPSPQDEFPGLGGVSRKDYCDVLGTMPTACFQKSLLEIWRYSDEAIGNLTQEQIINDINTVKISPTYGFNVDYSGLLLGVDRDSSGQIVSASAAQSFWFLAVDASSKESRDLDQQTIMDPATKDVLEWEKAFMEEMEDIKGNFSAIEVLYQTDRSFEDLSQEALFSDTWLLALGFLAMYVYTSFALGSSGSSSFRPYLAFSGIAAIAMGILSGAGVAAMLGFRYSPIHGLLPFLCLGIGIDDMFVIVQCWSNLVAGDGGARRGDVSENIGRAMRQAGAAITVTSVTDVIAFSAGSVTQMPGLRSFCMYCALSVLFIYLFQVTWFVAWFSLAQRAEDICKSNNQDGNDSKRRCCPMSHEEGQKMGMAKLGDLLTNSVPFKVLVVLFTLALAMLGLIGASQMKSGLEFKLFLKEDSHLVRMANEIEQLTSTSFGTPVEIYAGGNIADYDQFYQELDALVVTLDDWAREEYHVKEITSFWGPFKRYLDIDNKNSSFLDPQAGDVGRDLAWSTALSDFLHDQDGFSFLPDITFESQLKCGEPAPKIKSIRIHVSFLDFLPWSSGSQKNVAKAALKELIDEHIKSADAFSFSKFYAAWEIDAIMGFELCRNMLLAALGVTLVTLVLLGDPLPTACVVTAVSLSILDTFGLLHFSGVALNLISCVDLVMCVGVGVDYASHVALAYLARVGDGDDAVRAALTSIGPAVLNGGNTTTLAAVFVAFSRTGAFVIYFKVMTLMVGLALHHSLSFLPLLLDLVVGRRERRKKKTGEEEKLFKNVQEMKLN